MTGKTPKNRLLRSREWEDAQWQMPYLAFLFSAAAFLTIYTGCGWWSPQPKADPADSSKDGAAKPFVRPTSQFKNTSLDIKYVGSEACRSCHPKISESYHAHPMGRSLRRLDAEHPPLDFDPKRENRFIAGDFKYEITWDGKEMVHIERRVDSDGKTVVEQRASVDYEVGGGEHGRSYILRRGNTLWMSPATWYPQRNRWALSPKYEFTNQHFNRAVFFDCLYCHADQTQHQRGSINTYQEPPFAQLAIGCERCHGPGELHVKRHENSSSSPSGKLDLTIVNPTRLSPSLRDAVCQQCHLGGKARVPKRGTSIDEFRPGLPFSSFVATFLRSQPMQGERPDVTGHVEQMHTSKCFQEGKDLSCVTCHNPHQKPKASEKFAFYRQACLNCHETEACRAAPQARQETSPSDNCMSCHMPTIGSAVQHAAITDHRIPRQPMQATLNQRSPGKLILFQGREANSSAETTSDDARDLAVATMRTMIVDRQVATSLPELLTTLGAASKRAPDDLPAREAHAQVLFELKKLSQSYEEVKSALRIAPDNERMLLSGVLLAFELNDFDSAEKHLKALLKLNPHQLRYYVQLANAKLLTGEFKAGLTSAKKAIELDPSNTQCRTILISLLLAAQQDEAAKKEYELLQKLVTDAAVPQLKAWFENEIKQRDQAKK